MMGWGNAGSIIENSCLIEEHGKARELKGVLEHWMGEVRTGIPAGEVGHSTISMDGDHHP